MASGNSVYSPLPQSNSDSDEFSEEELHSSNERQRITNRLVKLQKQSTTESVLNGKKQDVTNYKQLDNERDIGIALNGFQLAADEIAVLKPNNRVEKFSISRKFCFIFSILLCLTTTIVFLWILPCEIGSCPSAQNLARSNSWKKVLFGIELYGPISVSQSARGVTHNLVFLYRKCFKRECPNEITPQSGGIISLSGENGKVSWSFSLANDPKDIDCNVTDLNLDGLNDCLLVGKNNLLLAVESSSGRKLWDIEASGESDLKSCDFSFPIVLPDLNGDQVSDLLTICSISGKPVGKVASGANNYFVLISGLTGFYRVSHTKISHCYSINNLVLEKETLVSYTCLDQENEESVKTVPLSDIISKVGSFISKKINLNQINLSTPRRNGEEKSIFNVHERRLKIENEGHCPENCKLLVTIKDERNEKRNRTVWTMKSVRSYGMIPVVMKFEKYSGFVLKYWHWESNKKDEIYHLSTFGNDSVPRGSMKMVVRNRRLTNPKSLDLELLEDGQKGLQREKRMLAKRQSNEARAKVLSGQKYNSENETFHKITERVVLILFNETASLSVNASQSEITQICSGRGYHCQPDVFMQRHSLCITDLDKDNFKELISYSTTFVNRGGPESSAVNVKWQLESSVQVIRLEEELPKLYDSKNQ